jgi:hypothetical protein
MYLQLRFIPPLPQDNFEIFSLCIFEYTTLGCNIASNVEEETTLPDIAGRETRGGYP